MKASSQEYPWEDIRRLTSADPLVTVILTMERVRVEQHPSSVPVGAAGGDVDDVTVASTVTAPAQGARRATHRWAIDGAANKSVAGDWRPGMTRKGIDYVLLGRR